MTDDLTLEEAAALLNVSPAFVAELIGRGELHQQGEEAHPRLDASDVLAYRDQSDVVAEDALREMTADAEAAGLYDE
ncbi:MAG: helix-turn-helix domain-containing protein [Acidimicrobiia bacterium]|nr:helix-turn-helix domain-containing protein [Acidimicrobiia bacterium]